MKTSNSKYIRLLLLPATTIFTKKVAVVVLLIQTYKSAERKLAATANEHNITCLSYYTVCFRTLEL